MVLTVVVVNIVAIDTTAAAPKMGSILLYPCSLFNEVAIQNAFIGKASVADRQERAKKIDWIDL